MKERKPSLWEQYRTDCPVQDLMYAEWLENYCHSILDSLKIAEQNVKNTEYQYSLFRRGAELTHNEMVEKLKIAEAERDELRRFSAELFIKCQRLSEKI